MWKMIEIEYGLKRLPNVWHGVEGRKRVGYLEGVDSSLVISG